MKKIFLVLALTVPILTFSQGILFEQGNWSEVLQKAKTLNKPVFVDVYTTWCGPCKQMAKVIFPMEKVGSFYNENFICYQIDAEKGEGIQVAKTYAVSSYPNFIFVKPDGSLFYRTIGSMPAEDFINQGKAALEELHSDKSLAQWDAEYNSQKTNPEFLYAYMQKRAKTNLNNSQLLSEYLQLIPDKFTEKVISLYNQEQYNLGVNCFAFKNLADNMDTYYSKMNSSVYSIIYYAVTGSIRTAAKNKDEQLLELSIAAYEKLPANVRPKDSDELYLEYYKRSKNIDKYLEVASKVCDKIINSKDESKAKKNAQSLNNFAWTVFETSENKATIEAALTWADKATQLEPGNPGWMDTKANLLYKLGRTKEAIETETQALSFINDENDAKPYRETLSKMKAGEKTW